MQMLPHKFVPPQLHEAGERRAQEKAPYIFASKDGAKTAEKFQLDKPV